jgi:hypothetical protein
MIKLILNIKLGHILIMIRFDDMDYQHLAPSTIIFLAQDKSTPESKPKARQFGTAGRQTQHPIGVYPDLHFG